MKTGGHKEILCAYLLSLPVRGAWIEIKYQLEKIDEALSRALRGERGLKCQTLRVHLHIVCRALRGECGLKYCLRPPQKMSLPGRAL